MGNRLLGNLEGYVNEDSLSIGVPFGILKVFYLLGTFKDNKRALSL
jgi:hypothetical protein